MARDDFEIVDEKPIGCGQFGTVFRARRRADGRMTALKLILRRGQSGADTIAAERHGATLQQEFAARRGMVPEVFEFGPDEDDFFIAMELVEGPSLEERLRDGALPYEEAIGHASWLCDFLAEAHAFSLLVEDRPYRLLHNDLKPAHLKIPEQGERKVLDFGIAKALEETRELATDVGRTIAYAAPERLLSERVNVHADFWSLGVMLYEMASGHRPYPDLEGPRHRRSLYTAITTNAPRAALPRDCPPHLQAIINRLLAFQPEHRYQSATEIRADLDRFTKGDTPIAAAYYETPATMPVTRAAAAAATNLPPVTPTDARPSMSTAPEAWARIPFPGATPATGSSGSAQSASGVAFASVGSTASAVASGLAGSPASPIPPASPTACGPTLTAPPPLVAIPVVPATDPVPTASRPLAIANGVAAATAVGLQTQPAGAPAPTPGGPAGAPPPLSKVQAQTAKPVTPAPKPVIGEAPAAAALASAAAGAPVPPHIRARRRAITSRFFTVLATLVVLSITASEGVSWLSAEHFRNTIPEMDERTVISSREAYDALCRSSFFDLGRRLLVDRPLVPALRAIGDRVIADYRREMPTMGTEEWRQAQAAFSWAQSLSPGDAGLRSKELTAEGHMRRLAAQKAKTASIATSNAQAAVVRFRDAAAADPASFDPYIGMAVPLVYTLNDVDGALTALDEATKRGFVETRREKALIGDAYMRRGTTSLKRASVLTGDERHTALRNARDDFERCVSSFGQIVNFGKSAENLNACKAQMRRIDAQLDDPSSFFWKLWGSWQ